MDFLEAVNRLEYDNTQPVSFQFMYDVARIILDDIIHVERSTQSKLTDVPEELIPFIP